ncbi:MAG TPA: GNAT family N-acetyltransferase [Rhodanobacter sp.]
MAVSPEARGRGVGRLLMDAALYESVGFGHHPAPRAGSHCARADVHMIWEP